jgi:spore germination protein KA
MNKYRIFYQTNRKVVENMFKIIKSIFYKADKTEGIKYKNIEDSFNSIFENGSSEPVKKQSIAPSKDLLRNKKFLQNIFNNCADITTREIAIIGDTNYRAICIYVANMIPQEVLENTINKLTIAAPNYQHIANIDEYCKITLGIDDRDTKRDLNKIVEHIIEGSLVIFINGHDKAYICDLKQPPARAVEQPVTENVIRGPREGFTESHATNICLVRKKISSPNLKVETFKIGRQTKTNVSMLYMSNIVNKNIVEEVRNRLNKIEIDSIVGASYIEEYIEDNPFSIFPTVFRTEKPDVAAGKLLEGRVLLIVDSIPVSLTVPTIFGEFFMAPDDYYLRFYVATLARWIRFAAFSLSIALPAAFVSLVTYHHELLPTPLVISVIRSRANIPFPPMVEALFMLITYLILQEADVRMPKTMGQAVSVVGGLVLGQAAISAGIVSAHMIIVVAFSAVAALAIPTNELQMPIAYIRFGLLVLSGLGGMVGLTCGLILIIMHLLSLRSFGTPYFAPIGPLKPKELIDALIRAPLWSMKKRPKTITWRETTRRKGRPATNPITEKEKLNEKLS